MASSDAAGAERRPGAPSAERVELTYESTGHVRIVVPEDVGEGPAAALVLVHGYGQPVERLLAWAAPLAPRAVLVAPEGPSSFYRDPRRPVARGGSVRRGWVADADRAADDRRNDRLIAAALDAAHERRAIDPARTVLLGFSQGVGVATHAFASAPERAAALVGLAGGVTAAFRPALAALTGKAVLWVTGARDEAYPPDYTAEVLAAWREAGVRLEAHEVDTGHDVLEAARPHVAGFLASLTPAWDAPRGG